MITLEFQTCLAVLLYGAAGPYAPYYPYHPAGMHVPYHPGTPTAPGGRSAPAYMCNICNRMCLTHALPMAMLIFMKAYLNASEVAKLLRIDRATVSRWLKKGIIQGAIQPHNTGQWRIPLEAYDKLVKSYRV